MTIWAALAGYTAGTACYLLSSKRHQLDSAARLAWTFACVSLLAHVACAFGFYHGWSHEAAYRDTARQTADVVGLNWGGGLYINYLFMAGWVADVIWWWRGLDTYRRRPWLLSAAWHSFIIFILFNATVIFESGFLRWLGLCLYVTLAVLWWRTAGDRSVHMSNKDREAIGKDETHELTGH